MSTAPPPPERIPPELWPQVSALFDEALALPEAERAAWLAAQDSTQPLLAQHLHRLLAAHATANTFSPPDGALMTRALGGQVQTLQAGTQIGIYRLQEPLGQGGMATVWAAEQTQGVLRRVALKLPHPGLELPAAMASRFERERDLLAGLEHPHIARLYDAGVSGEAGAEGQPFLAMELINGVPITQHALQQTLPQRLQTFLQVLDAVAFAHGRLVIHRDIKPNNILVTPEGEVKLLDFGIARLLGDAESASGALSGRAFTPDCASPEQLAGGVLGVTSDVYSLGVVLFELLTGQRPYAINRHAKLALDQQLQGQPIKPPSSMAPGLRRVLRGDLDAIVARAMAFEPTQRYASAQGFAGDIERHLSLLPVRARGDGRRYRWPLALRRHRVAAGATAAVLLALLLGLGVALQQAHQARQQAARAEAVQGLLRGFFEGLNPEQLRGGDISARQLVLQGSARAETALAAQPALRAEMLRLAGELLAQLEAFQPAAQKLDAALALYAELGQHRTLVALETRYTLMVMLSNDGLQPAAREQAQTLLRLASQGFCPANAWAQRVALHMARQTLIEGQAELALEQIRAAMALPEVAGVKLAHMRLLADEYSGEAELELGQYVLARASFERVLAAAPGVPQYTLTDRLNTRYSLLSIHGHLGDFARVVTEGRPLIDEAARHLGQAAPLTLHLRNMWAQAAARRGLYNDAVLAQTEVVRATADREAADGEIWHRNRAALAQMLGAAWRAEEGLPLARAAVAFMDTKYPQPGVTREIQRQWLGALLLRAGRTEEAATVLAQNAVFFRLLPGYQQNARYAGTLNLQGLAAHRLGRTDVALGHIGQACEIFTKLQGAAGANTLQCRAHQAWLQGDLPRFDETSSAYVAEFPAGHVVAAEQQLLRADMLARAGRAAEAAAARQAGAKAWQAAMGQPWVAPVLGFH